MVRILTRAKDFILTICWTDDKSGEMASIYTRMGGMGSVPALLVVQVLPLPHLSSTWQQVKSKQPIRGRHLPALTNKIPCTRLS